MTCPNCSSRQTWQVVRFSVTFSCLECGQVLRVNPQYTLGVTFLSYGLAVAIWMLTGIIGVWGFLLVIPLGYILIMILGTIYRHIVPPRLEIAGDVHLNG
jgi:hypothetical protein